MIKSDLRQSRPKALKMSYYAMAVLSVAVATVVAGITARLLQAEPIALLMLCAVISTAWLGGFGPALLAMTLALFAFYCNLLPPTNSFGWKHDFLHIGIAEVPRLVLFAITSLFVAFVVTTQRQATEALRRSRDDLQVANEDLKCIEAALLRSERYLTEAQRLTGIGSYAWNVASGEIIWSDHREPANPDQSLQQTSERSPSADEIFNLPDGRPRKYGDPERSDSPKMMVLHGAIVHTAALYRAKTDLGGSEPLQPMYGSRIENEQMQESTSHMASRRVVDEINHARAQEYSR